MRMRFNKLHITVDDLLLCLVVIFVILSSSTIYHYTIPVIIGKATGKALLYVFVILYIVKNRKFPQRGLYLSLILGGLMTLYVIFTSIIGHSRDSLISVAKNLLIPFYIYPIFISQLYYKDKIKTIFKIYADILVCIAGISVFFWLFGTLLRILPGRTEINYSWAGRVRNAQTYFYIYFETQTQSVDTALLGLAGMRRNVGIFCEAPAYTLFLTCALTYELISEKLNKKHVAILALALLTCLSTKSTLVLVIGFFLRFLLFSKNRNLAHLILKYIAIPLVAIPVVYIAFLLISDKMSTLGGAMRLDDMVSSLKAFLQNPIFGVGMSGIDEILQYTEYERTNSGLSMGAAFLARGGIYIMAIYAGSLFVVWRNKLLSFNKLALLTALLLLEFSISNIGADQLIVMLVCFGHTAAVMTRPGPMGIEDDAYAGSGEF